MKNTGLLLLLTFFGLLLITSCEKDEIEINESYVENYKSNKEYKIKLCVQKGNGDWHAIEVAKKAKDAHIAKGAIEPGICDEGNMMDEECHILTCKIGCGADVILAKTFQHKSLYLNYMNYSNTLMNEQAWAIQYCENMSESGYDNWRLGAYAEYGQIQEMCGSVYAPNDRRPYGLPELQLITTDTKIGSPFSHYGIYNEETPVFYSEGSGYYSSTSTKFMILCVHDN